MSGTTSRITLPTESKILEEFIADLWKISRWVSVGDNSPGVDSLQSCMVQCAGRSSRLA
jgi:hypothetical protein